MHAKGLTELPRRGSGLAPGLADTLLIGLTLLAPVLGGATQLWAQATLIFLGMLLILFSRSGSARLVLEWPVLLPLLGLVLLSAAGFLPAHWFATPAWRQSLVTDYQVRLPGTLSPQPWLTLENGLLLAASVVWAAWLSTRQWTLRRTALLSIYSGGLLALVGADLLLYFTDTRFFLWDFQKGGFGFFPNRNQTANLVGIGAVCLLALAVHAFRRQKRIGYLWATGYLVSLVALVINFSRSGLVIFFVGSLAWLLWTTLLSERKRNVGLGLGVMLLLLTAFFLFGGQTLERFVGGAERPPDSVEGRWQIYADAWQLLKEGSWHGIGLGNFPPVFAHYRVASTAPNWAIHPESDWLWLGIELGWLAPLLVLVAVGFWLIRWWPKRTDHHFDLRAALVVSALAFLVHGFLDVSGHRLGSAWPMLLLLSLLREESRKQKAESRKSEVGDRRSGGAFGRQRWPCWWCRDFGLRQRWAPRPFPIRRPSGGSGRTLTMPRRRTVMILPYTWRTRACASPRSIGSFTSIARRRARRSRLTPRRWP